MNRRLEEKENLESDYIFEESKSTANYPLPSKTTELGFKTA